MPVFLFNDIERSTRLWEEHQQSMAAAVLRHDAIMQEQIAKFGGRILRHRGDGVSAVFEIGEPLECALAIQRQFGRENWGEIGQLLIRIALHAGYAERREFDEQKIGQKEEFFGPVLNRTARVMDTGWGGQILLTPAVVNIYQPPSGAALQDLGVHLLKDLHDPQRIYGLTHPELPINEFPPLRSLSSHPHNLSPQPTPFVGREAERAKIASLLSEPNCRLLTLVGPGGIGKTRLALQVAAEKIDSFAHGVYAVQLAPVTSPQFLVQAIVDALKPPYYSGQDPKALMLNYLREKTMLIVMDNFEHLMDGVGLLTEILAGASNVKLLVTSRQRLNLQGEWLFQVQGMSMEDTTAQDSATQLFIQSARRVRPDFSMTESDIDAVKRICELVEGMPLGIELAAGWAQVLSPQEIVGEIESNTDFLVSSLQDVPERHRSLRAVFEHSWNMLSEHEREVLSRLSVFRGGFRHDAARQIGGVSLPVLLELVDKSLLRRTADGRYEMHEFLRQHAQRALSPEDIPAAAAKTSPALKAATGTGPAATAQTEPAAPPATKPALPELKNPYKGLRAFQESDAEDFFGRSALTQQLLDRMAEEDAQARFLAVVGPSGSGKSSVVKAGLIPALRAGGLPGSERWLIAEMLPSAYPLEELELALLRLTKEPIADLLSLLRSDERGLLRAVQRVLPNDSQVELVLVIDQFEELFTLVADEAARFHFLDSLMVAIASPRSRVRVVVTMRADFYDRPLGYAQFGQMMRARTEIVLPLSPDELEQAIVKPAERVGLSLGADLIAAIVADVSEQPGQLPLLQYTLTELFDRREDRSLTLNAYRTVGGVSGALALRAEELFAGLGQAEQDAARQLFLRLVTPGEGAEDTRRRVRLDELKSIGSSGVAMDAVMAVFSQYRLLTFDRDPVTHGPTVEVAHEALIREWKRLRHWLDASREDLRIHRRLMTAAAEWINAGKSRDYLAAGARLAQFEEWVGTTDIGFTQQEWDYLVASLEERELQAQQEQERLRREMELEQRSMTLERRSMTLQKRAADRLRMLVVTLAIFLVGAVGLSLFAFVQQGRAENALETSVYNRDVAETQVGIARLNSSLLLAASSELALSNRNTDLAIMLALEAIGREAPPEQALRALYEVADARGTRYQLAGHTGGVYQVAFSPDGQRAISASADATLILWNIDTGQELRRLEGHTDVIKSVVFSPDGRTALSSSQDGTLRLWNLDTGQELKQFACENGCVRAMAFLPDGKTVVLGLPDGALRLWDLDTGQEIKRLEGHIDAVTGIALSSDGKLALSGSLDGSLRLWDLDAGTELSHLEPSQISPVNGVALLHDGRLALSGSQDGMVRLWDLTSGLVLHQFEGHTSAVLTVAFSPDGQTALSGSRDGSIRLWNTESADLIDRLLGHTAAVTSAVFSSDGRRVLSGSSDTTLRLWDITHGSEIRRFTNHTDAVLGVAIGPDGKTAVSASGDTTLILWDLSTGSLIRQFKGHADWVRAVAFSPDGRTILSGSYDKTLILWDVETGEAVRRFENHTDRVRAVAFSPDGQQAISGADDGAAILWDVAAGTEIRRFDHGPVSIRSVAFSPDGRTILTGASDNTVWLWDAATGEKIRPFNGHADAVLSVGFSPDGKTALSSSLDNTLILWNVDDGTQLYRLTGHKAQVYSAAFSPDSKMILSGGNDGTMILWDAGTGRETRRFWGHSDAVYSIAFSPDGLSALSGSGDTTLRLWQIYSSMDEMVTWTRSNRYVGQFTCAEREQYRIEPLCDASTIAMLATATAYPTATPTPVPTNTEAAATATEPPTATLTPSPEPPTLTPTPTFTIEATREIEATEAIAAQPTATMEATIEPEIPTVTASPAETETPIPTATPDTAPVVLIYDDLSIVLFNRSDQTVNVSGLTFMQARPDSAPLSFKSDEWSGGSQLPSALPAGDCFVIWLLGTGQYRPDYCHFQAWREVQPERAFWLSTDPATTFEVRRADDILATCSVSAGQCSIDLGMGSASAAPTATVQITEIPASPTLTPLPTSTAAPEQPAEEVRPTAVPAGETPVVLLYDDQSLVLFNRSAQTVNVGGLIFVQTLEDGTRLDFQSDEWSGGSRPPYALPGGGCFAVWVPKAGTLPVPDYCAARHAWHQLSDQHQFWRNADPAAVFEVRRDDEILATCTVGAGECELDVN